MENYFGPFYFGELKPYNWKYCSNFVLFWPAVIIHACLTCKIRELKGTLTLRVLQYMNFKQVLQDQLINHLLHDFQIQQCTTFSSIILTMQNH